MKSLLTLILSSFVTLGCAIGPQNQASTSAPFQDFYVDEVCRTEPVYVQFVIDSPDMVKKVENGKPYFSFLGQEVQKGVPVYKFKDGLCSLQFFEKVKPFHVFRLGPWFEGYSQ